MDISDAVLSSFLDKTSDAVIWCDENQQIVFNNRSATDMFGYTTAEMHGMSLNNLVHTRNEDNAGPGQLFTQSRQMSPAEGSHARVTGIKKCGEEFSAEAMISPIPAQEKTVYSILLRDASLLPDSRQELCHDLNLYRTLVESQTNMIVRVDPEGCFTFVNQAYCEKFGVAKEDLLGKSFTPLVHPDDLAATMEAMKKLQDPSYRISIEQRAMTREGWRWLAWENTIIRDEKGNLIEIQGVGRDITDHKFDKMQLESQRDLALQLAGVSSMNEALPFCLERAIQVAGMDCGGIYLLDRQTRDLNLAYSKGLSGAFVADARRFDANTSQAKIVMQGKTIVTNYKDLQVLKSDVRDKEGLKAFILVPIMHQGNAVGCFNLSTHTQHFVSEAGQVGVEAIALQVGNTLVRIQAEEDMLESQQELQMLFDNIRDFIIVFNHEGRILKVNRQVIEQMGYAEEDLIGKPVIELHPEELREKAAGIVAQMLNGEISYCPLELLTRDGRRIPVETKVDPGKWRNQIVWIGVSRDISDRIVVEEELKFRSHFEDLLTRISTRFINLSSGEIDSEINHSLQEVGKFKDVDRSYLFLIDHTAATMNNTHEWCSDGIEPEIDNLQNLPLSILPWWVKKLQNNETIVIDRVEDMPVEAAAEKEILQAQAILSVAVIPLFVNKQLLGFVGFDSVRRERHWNQDNIAMLKQFGNILSNSIERKRSEEALRRSEGRNMAILNALPDAMFQISKEGVILDFIASDPSILVVTPEQVCGSPLNQILGPSTGQVALEKIEAALQTGSTQTMEYQLNIGNQMEHFEARFFASGENETIAIVRNVSERARLEQMKSDFINRATHDLRTPLTTILLMVRLLEGKCTPAEHDEYWRVLKEEVERERLLIEDLLMVGRLESNRWTVRLQPMDPVETLYNSIQTVNPQAAEKSIRIDMDDSQQFCEVNGDPSALMQVFNNLLNNAIKFTPPGGKIKVGYHLQNKQIWFTIQDTGIGISNEDIHNLFSRFFRGRNAIEKEVPGSGIGLFIVKSIIEHLGGRIQVESELGRGTTIKFWLPIVQATQ